MQSYNRSLIVSMGVGHQTWSNNQSQHDLLYGSVSLSISLNLKLALQFQRVNKSRKLNYIEKITILGLE